MSSLTSHTRTPQFVERTANDDAVWRFPCCGGIFVAEYPPTTPGCCDMSAVLEKLPVDSIPFTNFHGQLCQIDTSALTNLFDLFFPRFRTEEEWRANESFAPLRRVCEEV